MAYDFEGARAAGGTDEQIAKYLASKHNYDLDGAISSGGSYSQVLSYLSAKETASPAQPESAWEAGKRGLKESFQQVPQLAYGLEAGAGAVAENVFGEGGLSTKIKESGVKGYQEKSAEIASHAQANDEFDTAKQKAMDGDIGALGSWLAHGLGYVSGQTAQMVGTFGVGSLAGKALGKGAVEAFVVPMVEKEAARIAAADTAKTLAPEALQKLAVSNVASKIGQNIAMAGTAFGMEGGEIYGDLVSDASKEKKQLTGSDLGRAFLATVASGGLEYSEMLLGMKALKGKLPTGEKLAGIDGMGGRLARAGVQTAIAAPAEYAQEYGQTLLEEYGKGKDPLSAESLRQAGNAGALGGLGGGLHGTVGGLLTGARKDTTPPIDNTQPDPRILSATDAGAAIKAFSDIHNQDDAIDGTSIVDEHATPQRDFGTLSQGATGFGKVNELVDLVEQEKADLAQRRGGLISAQQQDNALRMDSGIESADNRVAGAKAEETRAARLKLLDDTYSNQDERTPGMTFLAQLGADYPHNPNPTAEEKQIIAKRESAYRAFGATEPTQPDEVAPAQAKPNAPRTPEAQIAQVDEFLANGYSPIAGGKMLANAKGKKLLLTVAQREYVKNKPPQEPTHGTETAQAVQAETQLPTQGVPADAVGQYDTPAVSNTIAPDSSLPTVNSDLATTPQVPLTPRLDPANPLSTSAPPLTEAQQPTHTTPAPAGVSVSAPKIVRTSNGKLAFSGYTKQQIQDAVDSIHSIAVAKATKKTKGKSPNEIKLALAQAEFKPKIHEADAKGQILVEARRGQNFLPFAKSHENALRAELAIASAPKSKRKVALPKTMSMLQFVASIGGFDRASVAAEFGRLDDMKKHKSGIFGTPAFRTTGGRSWDDIGEALAEAGYLPKNEHGQYDKHDLEERLHAELSGNKQYKDGDVIDNLEAEKSNSELDELRKEADSIGVDWTKYKNADDLWVAIDNKKFELSDSDAELRGEIEAEEDADIDFDFGTPMSAAQTEAWLEGVENENGNQGQVNGVTTGAQGEGNQRGAENSGAQGEGEQPPSGGELALTRPTEEGLRQQAAALEQAGREEEAHIQAEAARREREQSQATVNRNVNGVVSDNFTLGQSKDEVKRMAQSGVVDMFGAAKPAAENKVGDTVKLTKPGLNGRVNIAGTVSKILPDGRLEIKTQQDGYMIVAASELGHNPAAESKPEEILVKQPYNVNTMAGIAEFEQAKEAAAHSPQNTIVRVRIEKEGLYEHDPVKTLYGAFVANGDGTATWAQARFPASKENPSNAQIMELAEADRLSNKETEAKIAEQSRKNKVALADKGIVVGLELQSPSTYVPGKKGMTTFTRAKVVAIDDHGIAEVHATLKGSGKTYVFKADAHSRLFEKLETKPAQEQQATAILDRANVTGKDRLDIMAAFLEGKKGYTLDDLEKAYPDVAENIGRDAAAPQQSDEELGSTYRAWVSKNDHRISAYPSNETLKKYAKFARDILAGNDPLTSKADFERFMRLREYGKRWQFDLMTTYKAFDNGQDVMPDGTLKVSSGKAKPSQEPKAEQASGEGAQNEIDKTGGIRFSKSKGGSIPSLIIQHNLSESNLLHAERMGGIPIPSLAITQADHPMTGFGEITLVGGVDMADPKGYAATKVFGADIYSPRYPNVQHQFTSNMKQTAEGRLSEAIDATNTRLPWDDMENGPRELERSAPMMWQFLKDRGIEPVIKYREEKPLAKALQPFADKLAAREVDYFDMMKDPAFIDAAYQAFKNQLIEANGEDYRSDADAEIADMRRRAEDTGKDYFVSGKAQEVNQYIMARASEGDIDKTQTTYALERQISDAGLRNDMERYAKEFFDDIGANERIFQGYTNSGNRKYIPHTLDNVIKLLKKELRGGENFNYGVGTIRSKFTPQFKSIKQIQDAKIRLMDKAAFGNVKDEIDKEFFALAEEFGAYHPIGNKFGFGDTMSSTLYDAATMGLSRAFRENGFEDVPPEKFTLAAEFLDKLRALPTEYFEAKILRAVDLSEFKGAVVPEDISQKALDVLKKRGINNILKYKGEGDRAAKIKQLATEAELMFSKATEKARNPHTISTLTSAIDKAMGNGFAGLLEATGKFKLIESAEIGKYLDGLEKSHSISKDAFATQGATQRLAFYAKHLSNAVSSQAFIDEGYSALDVETKGIVEQLMRAISHNREVFDSVIKLIPVNVMDALTAQKLTPEMVFNNPSMLEHGYSIVDDSFIPSTINISRGLVRVAAQWAAKHGDRFDLTLGSPERSPTIRTNNNEGIVKGSTGSAAIKPSGFSNLGITSGKFDTTFGTIDNRHDVTPFSNVGLEASSADTGGASSIIHNGRVLGFVSQGKTFLIADNISSTDDNVKGLLTHEIGLHALTLGRSEPEFQAILKQFTLMGKMGNQKVRDAQARVPKDTPAHLIEEESLGYYLEKHSDTTFGQKVLAWFRAQIRKIGASIKGSDKLKFFQWANKLTPEDIVAMAAKALRSAPQTLSQAQGRGTFKADRGGQRVEAFARMALAELTADNDRMFSIEKTSSKSVTGAIEDVLKGSEYLGEVTQEDEHAQSGADHVYAFKTDHGDEFTVYDTDAGKVWINVSKLGEGTGGQLVYSAIADYAYNTGKKFIGDPYGLTHTSLIRRTVNMLTSAIRHGTTRHLEPAQQQEWGDPENGVEPLDWSGSDIDKIESLIHTFIKTSQTLAPSLEEYRYDFQTNQFIDPNGSVVDGNAIVARIKRDGESRASQKDRGGYGTAAQYAEVQGKPGTTGTVARNPARDAGIGEKTARRAVFFQSLLSAARQGNGERAAVLERILSWGDSSSPQNLDRLFSKAQQPIPGTAQPQAQPPRQSNIPLQGGQPGNRASWDSPEPSKLDNFIYSVQNKHVDLKRTIEAIKAKGTQIADKWDTYLNEELFHGRAAKRTQDFLNTELDPLLIDMAKANMSQDDLNDFLHARHAKEANALIAQRDPNMQDGGSGMTDQQADAYMAGLSPLQKVRFNAMARKVDAILAKTRELYVSYELVSRNQADEWAAMFQHYVPLMREDHDGGMGVGQGFSIKGKEVKHRTGSIAAVVDIFANIALQREKAITRGEKNRVAVSLAGLAKLNPNPDFWSFGKAPTERVMNEKTGLVEERVDPMFKSRDNVVIAKIKDKSGNIQERAVIFNEHNERAVRMAGAIKNLDATQLGELLGTSAKITRYFASINTQYNPVFGVTNLVRDTQGLLLNLSSTPIAGHKMEVLKHIPSALIGIYSDMRAERKGHAATSQWAQLWEELQDEGGMTGYRDLYRTSEERANAIKHNLNPYAWHDNMLGKIFTAGGALKVPMTIAQKKAGWLFDWLSDYNQAMEGATRLAAYKVAREQGMSKPQAASLAKNITVNFNRKGQIGQQAGALYAFFNASMQGTARIGETMFKMDGGNIKTLRLNSVGKTIVYGGITLGAMQALALAAAGFDDDEPKEFVREKNLIIPWKLASFGMIDSKQYTTIPMPLGFHVLPNIGRITTEWALSGFKDPGKRTVGMLGVIVNAFNPIGGSGFSMQTIAPTPLDPLAALAENKDGMGNTIYKEERTPLSPTPGFTRNKDTATYLSKMIAEGMNYVTGGDKYKRGMFSPTADQLDYLIGQVTGGVGREVSKAWQAGASTMSGEELPAYKVPLAGRFYGNAGDQSSQSGHFYENLKRINEIESGLKGRQHDRATAQDIQEFRNDNPEYRLIMRANYAEKIIQNLHKQKRDLIEKNAPRERIKAVEDRITVEMLRFNNAVKMAKEKRAA